MITVDFSPKVNTSKQVVVFPFFAEDVTRSLRSAFQGLSPLQKRTVRRTFRGSNIPKSGVMPIFSNDGLVLVVFLGKRSDFGMREAREAGEKVFALGKKYQSENFAIVPGILKNELWMAFREGVVLGSYEFADWKGTQAKEKAQKTPSLKKVQFVESKNAKEKKRLEAIFEGVKLTRDIINLPPMEAHPAFMEQVARDLAKKFAKASVKVFQMKELQKMNCGGIVGVGQGSQVAPRLIILEYKGGGKEKPVALVGKGVTYDTGGLSIKPSRHMASMKQDLGGAATILGAFSTLASMGVKKNFYAIVPTVENAVSSKSYKPDDILHMYNGKTVEVTNTDAEGRLILADALAYTEKNLKPRAMVDLATLTGACAYAVGEDFTAGLTTDTKLLATLQKAGKEVQEEIWELPLHKRYRKAIDSPVADIVNASYKLKCGTIEGGLFLHNFVTEKMPWCHLDIASVTFDDNTRMATGRNVRMLCRFVEQY